MRAVLQRLLENRLFVKAEKCVFHAQTLGFLGFRVAPGRLEANPENIKAVKEWPKPNTRRRLQQFLGFANFYRRFIRDYSRIAAPLTRLTSPKQPFKWDSEAEEAFCLLKTCFSTHPILVQPDRRKQFVVEVDALETGVGAVLSQRAEDGKLHPCAFFSRRLTAAKRNYDVGNRELLTVKLALDEWRHWLEGAEHPFVIWTDHKNLAYIRDAKRLNAPQARWQFIF